MLHRVKKNYTILFFVLINTIAFSQTTSIPTTVLSGIQYDFMGRDLVKFQQGVLYKALGTSSLKARIDENIVVPVSSDGGYVSETSSSRSLDKSLSVGSIQDNFEVSLFGSANYNMQIATPPGTKGMQPNISLSYNSNAGESYMGIGWSISGLSRISRTGKNMYSDKVQSLPIQYNASDVFELDGNRLVLTSDGYRTEIETFQKITILASGVFQVETKDGIIMEYGNTADSRRIVGGVVVDYYLNKVMDKFGNYYTYTYRSSNGTIQPISIDYTMNNSGSVSISSYNKITFVYDVKPAGTETPVYENGTALINNMLLKEIRVYSEGKRSNSYVLNYNFDDTYIHLVDVQRTGANGEKMNKTVFNWNPSTGINTSHSNIEDGYLYADFTGDGNSDRVYIGSDYLEQFPPFTTKYVTLTIVAPEYYYPITVMTSVVSGSEYKFKYRKPDYDIKGNLKGDKIADGVKTLSHFTIKPTSADDYNGDGINDLILEKTDRDADGNLTGTYTLTVFTSEYAEVAYPYAADYKFVGRRTITLNSNNYITGDFNGDGASELMAIENGNIALYYGKNSDFVLISKKIYAYPQEPLVRLIKTGIFYFEVLE